MTFLQIHHVSLTTRDLAKSRRFYREVLGLSEIARPPFPFDGAWFQLGETQQLHLIANEEGSYRPPKINTKDVHFALRVPNYMAALELLRARGVRDDEMVINPRATAGFPQLYVLDPDNHVIEINAERLD